VLDLDEMLAGCYGTAADNVKSDEALPILALMSLETSEFALHAAA
jgi:hypothetical protein